MKTRARRAFRLILALATPVAAHAQWHPPHNGLKRICFNLYTDSIKTVMAYYVNVEGEYLDGSILPMDSTIVRITADAGMMRGCEWRAPQLINFEKVSFRAEVKDAAAIHAEKTVWLKRTKDPRDEPGYEDRIDLPTVPDDLKKRRR